MTLDRTSRLVRLALVACAFARAGAQRDSTVASLPVLFVNDEWERYARILQVGGDALVYPWSVRGFGLREQRMLGPTSDRHPWSKEPAQKAHVGRGYTLAALPLQGSSIFNSAFPYGYNDGAVWAGRGLTNVVSGGFVGEAGPLSVVFAPLLFRAQNRSFPLQPTGFTGPLAFAQGFQPGVIDLPQRFGDDAYGRLDPGNSTIRLDLGPAAIGFSTANEQYGPARDHPIILGNNAPGFPHYFVGSSRPLDLWIVKIHGRMLWGRLAESPYSIMETIQPWRFATGLVGIITPRGVPGLEIGGSRFFHILWSDTVLTRDNLLRTLEGLTKTSRVRGSGNATGNEPDNQLGSLFARWVFPTAGLEVYGEYGRDTHNVTLRDLQLEPDYEMAYLVGFQRVLRRSPAARTVLRAEALNARINGLVISREEGNFYIHNPVQQGHTNRGQVMGSVGAFGGGAAILGVDRYSPQGRQSFTWSRIMQGENRPHPGGPPDPQRADVMHALGIDGIRFRGRAAVTYELTGVYELNRNYARDEFDVRAALGVRYVW